MHPLHDYVAKQLAEKVKSKKLVVWYDARGEFAPFIAEVRGGPRTNNNPVPVSVAGIATRLAEYAGSMFELRAVVEPRVSGDTPESVVIYLPGCERDRRASVLMELEKAGECYEPQLKRLARNVLRQRYTDGVIDEMLAPERVTYEDFARASSDSSSSGDASIAMFGNTNQPVDVMVQTGHLFAPMPDVIRDDMAFIDRLHFYLPGWEIPKMRNDLFTNHYGFVVDYLAEALRELRKHNFTEIIDRHFSLGSHLNARDRKAVRKTVSGLMKIVFPHGEVTQDELGEILELAIEGRRRVKEQLKKMGAFEYYHTSFSYTLQDTGEERFVGVPEQGGRDLISTDPLPPGTVYTAGANSDGTVGLYRVEVSVSSGTGKLKLAGGVAGAMKESVQRAFSYLQTKKSDLGIGRDLDTSDLHVEVIDLLHNHVEAEVGVAFFVACYSGLRKAPVSPALLVLGDIGDMSVQGNIKALRSLVEPLQVAMDNGAKRALIPIENNRTFLDVSADIVEHVDPIFYGDPKTAAMKVLGLT